MSRGIKIPPRIGELDGINGVQVQGPELHAHRVPIVEISERIDVRKFSLEATEANSNRNCFATSAFIVPAF
jgi:hypothetical protein